LRAAGESREGSNAEGSESLMKIIDQLDSMQRIIDVAHLYILPKILERRE
jgi:hypothetical protein